MIIDELITLLGFDITGQEKAQAYAAINESLNGIAVKTSAAIGALGVSIFGAAKQVAFAVAENYEWAESNGVAFESMQRLEALTNAVGGDLSDAQGFMQRWARVAATSGRSIEDILEEVAQRFRGIPAEQQKALAEELNYSSAELRVFQMTAEERKRILNGVSIVQKKDAKAALEYTVIWRNATLQISRILTTAVSSALPEIKAVVDELSQFVTTNKDIVTSGVASFFKAVSAAIKDVLPPILKVISSISGLINVLSNLKVLTFAVYTIFSLWAASLTLKAVTGIISVVDSTKQMILSIQNVITAIGGKIAAMQTETVTQQINRAATLNGAAAEIALTNAVNLEKMTTFQFVKVKLVEIGLRIKESILNLRSIGQKTLQAVITWRNKIAIDAENASLARRNILTLAGIKASLKLIWVTTVQIAKAVWATVVYIALNAAQLTAAAGLAILTAAQWALNVAMYANPIGLIIAGILALVAAVVLAVKYWDEIVSSLKSAWNWMVEIYNLIVDKLSSAILWVMNLFRGMPKWLKYLLMFLNPISMIIGAFQILYDAINRIMEIGVIEYFKELWQTALNAWGAIKKALGFSGKKNEKNKASQKSADKNNITSSTAAFQMPPNRAPVSSTVINQTRSNVANNQRQNIVVNVNSPAAAEVTMKRLNILNTAGLRA